MAWLILLGQYLIAIPFLIPLLQELDPIFGKKEESKENRKKELQRQLTEVFSPLHYVITRISEKVNLENWAAYQTFDVVLVSVENIGNWNKVVDILNNHAHDIGDERFKKWLTFKLVRDTSGKLCFGVDRYWAKWLVSLEADYQRLSKELAELTK